CMVQESMVTMESFSLSLVAVGSAAAVVYLCVAAWVSWPRRVGETFRRQGIDGPPPSSFLMGNLSEMQARVQQAVAAEEDGAAGGLHKDDGFDDYCKRIFPYFDKWRKAYGGHVSVLAPAAAGAVRDGPGADPGDRPVCIAGHGQADVPAEGPRAHLRRRRPQDQRRLLGAPAQGHRARVLHGQGQRHGGAHGRRGAAATAFMGGLRRRRQGWRSGGGRRRRHPELLLRRHLPGLFRRRPLQGEGDLPPAQGAVGVHVRAQRHLHHPVAEVSTDGEEPEDLEAHAGDPITDPGDREGAPGGDGGFTGARLPGVHHRQQRRPATAGRLRGGQLQEHLLRGARNDCGHRHLVPHAARRPSGVAGPRARRGARRLRRRHRRLEPGLRHDLQDEDSGHGCAGDATAVPAVIVCRAGDVRRHSAGPAARAQGHLPLRAGIHHAPRRRFLGPDGAPVRPGPVQERGGGGVQEPAGGVHAIRPRRAHLPRSEPRDRRGQDAPRRHPRAVCHCALAGLQALPGVPANHRAGVRTAASHTPY
uniref:Uncharacterized protein n=1 Tax=Aegilops tauschii subsp. strangulata TaxID=200361 RepID=A0A452ZD30_AEGTS